jgi:predicted PurR-regulated permease PerM
MNSTKAIKVAAILSILVLLTVIVVFGKPFFIPLAFAGLLSMLLLPLAKWLQTKGIHRTLAILLSMLTLVAFSALLVAFVSWELSSIVDDASKLERKVAHQYHQARQFIAREFHVSAERQQEIIEDQQSSSFSTAIALFNGIGPFLANLLLIFVYIFLFMYFRSRIKGFIVRLVPLEQRNNALATIHQAQNVAQQYLTGLSLMIASLWVMYSIGFSIAGVENAILFAIICGLLEIVPFVGNLTGTALTVAMTLIHGGTTNQVIGVVVTYGLVQFIQTYLLEPLVVGAEVKINPLATIVGLAAGELLWGIPGMILAIPLMGIARIICDHVPALQPYAYLMGQEKKKGPDWREQLGKAAEKVKALFQKK